MVNTVSLTIALIPVVLWLNAIVLELKRIREQMEVANAIEQRKGEIVSWCFDAAPKGVRYPYMIDMQPTHTFEVYQNGEKIAVGIGVPANSRDQGPSIFLEARGFGDTRTVWNPIKDGSVPSSSIGRKQ